ncbi:MAG: hypothetical protein HY049_09900 [Acidobacteria bacterium]|nr:hypothetical protein [Acidobacteriota bacterium]
MGEAAEGWAAGRALAPAVSRSILSIWSFGMPMTPPARRYLISPSCSHHCAAGTRAPFFSRMVSACDAPGKEIAAAARAARATSRARSRPSETRGDGRMGILEEG